MHQEDIDQVTRWEVEGRVTSDEAHALIEEARRRENVDPYEGEYLEGDPDDAWAFPYMAGRRVWVVNAYRVTRQYGGPEEGGWWVNVADPGGVVAGPFLAEEDADEVRGHLQAFANVNGGNVGDIYSVMGGHETRLRVESCIGHDPIPSVYC